jgi:hypothetical protein
VELRALTKAKDAQRHDAWARARMIAHWVYLSIPAAKGTHKETDPRRFYPLPGDNETMDEPTVIHITDGDIKELNRIKSMIR